MKLTKENIRKRLKELEKYCPSGDVPEWLEDEEGALLGALEGDEECITYLLEEKELDWEL